MKILSTKVDIPESYFGIEFTDVSLYFYEDEGGKLIRLIVNGVKLGRDVPIGLLEAEEPYMYSEENILRGVKDVYPEFLII